MGATVGRETDAVTFLADLAAAPYRYDFYQTLRRLECLYADRPRWGDALRPVDEPVRLGQDPDLSFAPASLAALERSSGGRPPRLQVRLFGLLGPNGPLPLHLTEYARERLRNHADPTLSRFLDLFHHRLIALFYRAWAQAQPHVNRDRPADDHFSIYVGAMVGLAPAAFRGRDRVHDVAKLFLAGRLVPHVRNAEGLQAILQHYFGVPVRIEQNVGHHMLLDERDRSALGRDSARLGLGAVLGRRIWDRQHKFRIHLGPLSHAQYLAFLPSAGDGAASSGPAASAGPIVDGLRRLVDWVRLYCGFEHAWDVRLHLAHAEVPRLQLGGGARLGWTAWLGMRRTDRPAGELCLDPEAYIASHRGATA